MEGQQQLSGPLQQHIRGGIEDWGWGGTQGPLASYKYLGGRGGWVWFVFKITLWGYLYCVWDIVIINKFL